MNLQSITTQYLEYCQYRKELDAKTLKAYRIDLRQFFEYIETTNPEKREIEGYITNLHKGYKQRTVKRKIASVKAFYSYLEEMEVIKENPFQKIKVKFKEAIVLPRIIPRSEIEKLLNYMYRRKNQGNNKKVDALRDLAVIEIFFATGARVCEISGLRKDCVDLESGVIRIKGKGNKERYVQISDENVIKLLRQYYEAHETQIKESGYFFINKNGNRFTEQSIRDMLKKHVKSAKIELYVTPHMFRHSVATYLIEEGVDISCVQSILGHSSIKTTQIYIHVATKKQAEMLRMMHPRNQMNINDVA